MARSAKRFAVIHIESKLRMLFYGLDMMRDSRRYRQALRRSPAITCAFLTDVSGTAKHGSAPALVPCGVVVLDG
jgi:hypothetical protein